jgi:hypothetical protein
MNIQNSIQYQICIKVKQETTALSPLTVKEVCYMMFKNLQHTDTSVSGLRLTSTGFKVLSKRYEAYKFKLGDSGLQKSLLIKLHEKMQWPYYLDKKFLYLFNSDDAMWLKLSDSSVEKFAKDLD